MRRPDDTTVARRQPPRRLAVTAAAIAIALAQGAQAQQPPAEPLPLDEMRALASVYALLRSDFVADKEGRAYVVAAIKGMLREVDPDGGEYYTEQEVQALGREPVQGAAHTGVELSLRGDGFVLAPLPDGAALAAGVRAGDVLLAVDGTALQGWSLPLAVNLLKGAAGSKAVLTVARDGQRQLLRIEVERRAYRAPAASVSRQAGGVAVLRVPQLREETLRQAAEALSLEWAAQPFRGLVLDLRGNLGGPVDCAVNLAGVFLPPGAVVVRMAGRGKSYNQEYRNTGEPRCAQGGAWAGLPQALRALPLAVLVDEGTASGAEMVAAAVKDHGRALLAGRKTQGRGSVHALQILPGGGAVKFTAAHWQSPSGSVFHGRGLEPELPLPPGGGQRDIDATVAAVAARLPAATAR